MALRKIGKAVTGTNGKCVIPYTGVGVGRLQMRGQYEEDGRVIQSATYEVVDCIFYDEGHSGTGHYNDTWTNQSNNLQVTRNDEYTTLTPTNSSGQNRYILPSGAIPSAPFVLEFNKHYTSTHNEIIVLGSRAVYMDYYDMSNASHVKLQINDDGTIYIWVDGVRKSDSSYRDMSNIRWQIGDTSTSIKYSEFKVYPI